MPSFYYSTEGIVLKKMPFREADFLVRIFTKDFGKIDVLAKGARKAMAKLNPHIDILNRIRVSFVKNGDRIPTLTDAEIIERYDEWFLNADRFLLAERVLRTIDIVIQPEQKDEKFFVYLCDFFKQVHGVLNTNETDIYGKKFLREFFLHEGYGDRDKPSSLPADVGEDIMNVWHGKS